MGRTGRASSATPGRAALWLCLALGSGPAWSGGEPENLRVGVVDGFYQHLYQGAFREPSGIFFEPESKELYVADTKNNLIGIFSTDGLPLFAFGDDGSLQEPVKVVVDRRGRIYVLDADRSQVKVFDFRGQRTGAVALPELGTKPTIAALGMDTDGNLYVGEHQTCQVLVFNADGELTLRFGSRGSDQGQFLAISAIAADEENIYVVDHVAKPVQVFSRRGTYLRGWGAHEMGAANFSLPAGIAVDGEGRVVVIDSLRHEVKFFDPEGVMLGRVGGFGSRPGEVRFPSDVAIDSDGRVYVTDRGGGRVQVYADYFGKAGPSTSSGRTAPVRPKGAPVPEARR